MFYNLPFIFIFAYGAIIYWQEWREKTAWYRRWTKRKVHDARYIWAKHPSMARMNACQKLREQCSQITSVTYIYAIWHRALRWKIRSWRLPIPIPVAVYMPSTGLSTLLRYQRHGISKCTHEARSEILLLCVHCTYIYNRPGQASPLSIPFISPNNESKTIKTQFQCVNNCYRDLILRSSSSYMCIMCEWHSIFICALFVKVIKK